MTLSTRCPMRRAYPRRCGENPLGLTGKMKEKGLPPQVRGELGGHATAIVQTRLTPAGAGRTMAELSLASLHRAYPRRCGENRFLPGRGVLRRGLPPQVRGELAAVGSGHRAAGLTPAGAGRTGSLPVGSASPRAYPRRCGENARVFGGATNGDGLPPQVRGEHGDGPGERHRVRLTPAGAGRTLRDLGF